jgi:spermidine synthase
MNSYNFLLIVFIVFSLYFGSLYLVKRGKIELFKQRQFWNLILLVSFLISGTLGLVLAFFIDQKMSIAWYGNMLWIHVELGIVMALIAIFHAFWHLKYFQITIRRQ